MAEAAPDLRAAIEALPGIDRLLAVLDALPPAYLVGGAVRDLLRGEQTKDLDIALEGPAPAAAEVLAARLGGEVERRHERFGTASLRAGELSVDLATARRERYPSPGALPEVEPATIEEDLARRDFTVNAMAAPLDPGRRGALLDLHGGRADLAAGVIRVLHPASFSDDPTRLLRAVRYAARLGFTLEPETDALARRAVADRVSDTVSGQRIGAELLLLLGEPRVGTGLELVVDLGLDRALDPALEADSALAARTAGAAPRYGAEPPLAALAALVARAPEALSAWLGSLGLPTQALGPVERAARSGPTLAVTLREQGGALSASALHDLLSPEPSEALALAQALGAPPGVLARYVDSVRSVRLAIGGDDLVAAGVDPSPALGRALDETLRRKLDGEVAGREEELRVALALARGENGGR